jgi:hypothetical protein
MPSVRALIQIFINWGDAVGCYELVCFLLVALDGLIGRCVCCAKRLLFCGWSMKNDRWYYRWSSLASFHVHETQKLREKIIHGVSSCQIIFTHLASRELSPQLSTLKYWSTGPRLIILLLQDVGYYSSEMESVWCQKLNRLKSSWFQPLA